MQKLTYRITALSPLLFAMNVGDTNMVATKDYIPGSVIMGYFANKYIKTNNSGENAHTDDTFYQWFLKGNLQFGNAYIISEDEKGKIKKNFPIPISIHEEKDDKGIIDLLHKDQDFEGQTNRIGGFGRIDEKRLYKQPVKKSLNFHHQRDHEKGTVDEGRIFNYESISAGQIFEGNILGSQEELNGILKLLEKEQIIYLGRSKNAQYGKCQFKVISEQLEKFDSEIDELNIEIESGEVSLTLLSDAIIYNKHGFSTTWLKYLEEELEKTLGANFRIKKTFMQAGTVENFVSIWRLCRPSEVCFMAGSCFLIEGVLLHDKDKLLELQKNGIGERRGEGFGRIVIGWQNDDELKNGTTDKIKPKKPTFAIPAKTREIVKAIVNDFIQKQVELKALLKVNDFVDEKRANKGLPSKSMIDRLEAMVKNSRKIELEKLRKHAKDQLKNCRVQSCQSQTLYQCLEEYDIEKMIKHFRTNDKNLDKLCNEIGYIPENEPNLKDKLHQEYLLTFFAAMRRKIKKQNG